MESEFESLQDDDEDEDDTVDIEFEEDVLAMVARAKELDFEWYE